MALSGSKGFLTLTPALGAVAAASARAMGGGSGEIQRANDTTEPTVVSELVTNALSACASPHGH